MTVAAGELPRVEERNVIEGKPYHKGSEGAFTRLMCPVPNRSGKNLRILSRKQMRNPLTQFFVFFISSIHHNPLKVKQGKISML
jgi:hypothetical protein